MGPVVDVGSFHGRDIHVHFGLDTVPASFGRRIKQFVDGYLGSDRMPVAFGGRSTELNALNAWFQDPDAPSHLLVAAEAGRGKTALLVRWLEQLDDDIPLAFVPISIRYQTSRPTVFFQAFAARLAYLLGETLPTATSDPAEFYKEKLAEYLEALEDRGAPCLIVVDGLDEATGWQFDAGLLPACTGSCLRVLVSARILAGDQDETGWLRRLEWDDPDASVRALRIPPLNPTGIADVLRQTSTQLAPFAEDEDLVADLDRLTAGDPLLLTFYVADLRQWLKDGEVGRPNLSDSAAGFGPYFERWLRKQGGIYQDTGAAFDEQIIKAILAILACAIGPLPQRDLAALVERLTEERYMIAKDTMAPLERFIVGDGNDLGYALGHPKLRNYIRDEYFGGSNNVARADAVFVDWGREKIDELASGKARAADVPHYLLQFHAQHLQVVGADAVAFRELLSPTWRAAWEADRQGEGYLGLSNDVEIATHAMIEAMGAAEASDRATLWADIFGGMLISNSIQRLSSGIPPALLAKALEHDALAVGSALHFASRREPAARLKAIAAVAEALSDNRRRIVLEEAFASITTFRGQDLQGVAIADLAPFLPPDLLSEALEFALNFDAPSAMKHALLGLSPVLDPQNRSRALDAAFKRLPPEELFSLASALAPEFYEDRQTELVALAKKRSNLHDRAIAFRDISDVLDAETQQMMAQEALRVVLATDHTRIDWNDILNALAPLRSEIRGPIIAEIAALTKSRYIEDVDRRVALEMDPEFGYAEGQTEGDVRPRCEHEVRTHYAPVVVKLSRAADAYAATAIFDLVQTSLDPTTAFQCVSMLALQAEGIGRQVYIDAALQVMDQEVPASAAYDRFYTLPMRETIERVEAIATLADLTDGPIKARLNREAKELAHMLPLLESARCLNLLPRQDRPDVVRGNLAALAKSGYVEERQEALALMAPHLDASTVDDALRVATRVSTGDDIAPLINALSGHLSRDNTHVAFKEAMSFSRHACIECLQDLGPHLSAKDAIAALDRLAKNHVQSREGIAEVEVLTSLPLEDRQSFMQSKLSAWRARLLQNTGSFSPEPVHVLLPAMTPAQRDQMLDMFFDHQPRRSGYVMAELLNKTYVDTHPDARDKITAYLSQADTLDTVKLCRTLREIFEDDVRSVLPEFWPDLRGIYDLPRYYALGLDPAAAAVTQEIERFAKTICEMALKEYDETFQAWQEWTDAMKDIPAEAATRHADALCVYLREAAQPRGSEQAGPASRHEAKLLQDEIVKMAQFCAPYLSPEQLHALLDLDMAAFNAEIIAKEVFKVATGPVFDRALTLLDGAKIADLSTIELACALRSKTRREAQQVYTLWRAEWPDVAQFDPTPFLPYLEGADVAALAEDLQTTAPHVYLHALPDLLASVPADYAPRLAQQTLAMLPDTFDLHTLAPIVASARGDALSQALHLYVKNAASRTRKDLVQEISTVSVALTQMGPVGTADAIFERVSTVLTHWQ